MLYSNVLTAVSLIQCFAVLKLMESFLQSPIYTIFYRVQTQYPPLFMKRTASFLCKSQRTVGMKAQIRWL